jgi:hypothetical protein
MTIFAGWLISYTFAVGFKIDVSVFTLNFSNIFLKLFNVEGFFVNFMTFRC